MVRTNTATSYTTHHTKHKLLQTLHYITVLYMDIGICKTGQVNNFFLI